MSENNTNNKKSLGQFFTKNYEYILQTMLIPENVEIIIEPFTGDGDLLHFLKNNNKNKYKLECYDIEPKHSYIIKQDTIQNPPNYNNKFVFTNPPYLARNKSSNKLLFDKYDVNDLYKCFIKEIIKNPTLGGIIIVPLNFWSSIRKNDIVLRKVFLEIYNITIINIFEEQVFSDTTYTICSFQFTKKSSKNNTTESNSIFTTTKSIIDNTINITLYPSKTKIQTILNDNNNYMIGGEIYNLITKNKYKITRLTSKNKNKQNTNIIVKCIDDNKDSKIGLTYEENSNNLYIDETENQSARTYATLIIEPCIDINIQKLLVLKFNTYLNKKREKYSSLFLTNYRESKDIARKRISFDLVYLIVEYILDNLDTIDILDLETLTI